jgi:NADPH2:quinone reductase
MRATIQKTMQAAAIDHFGGVDAISLQVLPVPQPGPDEILIHVESAGVGSWDPFEREGGFASMMGRQPKFPYVMGTDGAGTVIDVGGNVTRFKEGDRVYGMSLANPKGGFYAQFAVIKEDNAAIVPDKLSTEQAGVLACDAITALRGLDDAMNLKPGESVLILGASGGVGHLAVQLAKNMGARVLAVASGDDGVALAARLGADAVIDGHKDDIVAAAESFAPDGLDAALLTAGGEAAEQALSAVRQGGRAAFPNGVEPEPQSYAGINVTSYDGMPDHDVLEKLNHLIESGPFDVHVARVFKLEQAADAHRALDSHYLGKLALRPA